jgi:hypothetical protein
MAERRRIAIDGSMVGMLQAHQVEKLRRLEWRDLASSSTVGPASRLRRVQLKRL